MQNNLSRLCEKILTAKAEENRAKANRQNLEDELASLVGVPKNLEGSQKAEPNGYKVTLMTESDGLWLAKSRSDRLDAWEAPDLSNIITKIKGEQK